MLSKNEAYLENKPCRLASSLLHVYHGFWRQLRPLHCQGRHAQVRRISKDPPRSVSEHCFSSLGQQSHAVYAVYAGDAAHEMNFSTDCGVQFCAYCHGAFQMCTIKATCISAV